MNCRLEKCGSLAVLVSLRTILPVDASATNKIDREEAALGQERDPRAVGADRRADVQIAAKLLPLDDQRADFGRRRRRGRQRP